MPYKVVNDFIDTKDNDTFYEADKPYPKGDYRPSEKRIQQLSREHPEYKRVFIKEVKETSNKKPSAEK